MFSSQRLMIDTQLSQDLRIIVLISSFIRMSDACDCSEVLVLSAMYSRSKLLTSVNGS